MPATKTPRIGGGETEVAGAGAGHQNAREAMLPPILAMVTT